MDDLIEDLRQALEDLPDEHSAPVSLPEISIPSFTKEEGFEDAAELRRKLDEANEIISKLKLQNAKL